MPKGNITQNVNDKSSRAYKGWSKNKVLLGLCSITYNNEQLESKFQSIY